MTKKQVTKFQISLAAARVNAGLTQAEAAEKAHVSNKTINNWENGKVSPSFANVELLCRIYGISSDYIFYLQNPLKVIARKETPMKRNQEVSIIIQSLLENGLLQEKQTDRARSVVKEAFKEIRRVRYEERHTKNC